MQKILIYFKDNCSPLEIEDPEKIYDEESLEWFFKNGSQLETMLGFNINKARVEKWKIVQEDEATIDK